ALHSRLKQAYAEMTHWGNPASDPEQTRGRSPGAIFVWFEDLSPSDIAKIKQRIEAVEEPVSKLQSQLGQS
ncbi:MAG TPA: hypothetical protein VNN15_04145, partial [Solirubrobacterales bacterium]|nr:hypothetical protein [Solirubrobacterales bacterium]